MANIYQWQVNRNDGNGYVNLSDGVDYTGTTTNTLQVLSAETNQNGFLFRVIIEHEADSCTLPITSSNAVLNINVRTVITNRRITYRVKPN